MIEPHNLGNDEIVVIVFGALDDAGLAGEARGGEHRSRYDLAFEIAQLVVEDGTQRAAASRDVVAAYTGSTSARTLKKMPEVS